jgi:hypothetical protein
VLLPVQTFIADATPPTISACRPRFAHSVRSVTLVTAVRPFCTALYTGLLPCTDVYCSVSRTPSGRGLRLE